MNEARLLLKHRSARNLFWTHGCSVFQQTLAQIQLLNTHSLHLRTAGAACSRTTKARAKISVHKVHCRVLPRSESASLASGTVVKLASLTALSSVNCQWTYICDFVSCTFPPDLYVRI